MTDDRNAGRADKRPPEETVAGTDVPTEQAAAVLADSDRRQADRDAAPGTTVEHRRSDQTVD